jgi:Concanavalin A-like lectin/glucanases superfamily
MARSFNGSSDHISLGTTKLPTGNSAISVAAWVMTNITSGSPVISCMGTDHSGGNQEYLFYLQGNNMPGEGVHFVTEFGSGSGKVTGSITVSTGQWYHVVATYDGATNRLYVNGTADGSTSYSSANFVYGVSRIGDYVPSSGGESNFWNGNISEWAVWNVALSANEIAGLANSTIPCRTRPASLVAYLPLWGLQSPEPDLSGNQNNGVLTGTSYATHAPVTVFTRKARTQPIPGPASKIFIPQRTNPVIGSGVF